MHMMRFPVLAVFLLTILMCSPETTQADTVTRSLTINLSATLKNLTCNSVVFSGTDTGNGSNTAGIDFGTWNTGTGSGGPTRDITLQLHCAADIPQQTELTFSSLYGLDGSGTVAIARNLSNNVSGAMGYRLTWGAGIEGILRPGDGNPASLTAGAQVAMNVARAYRPVQQGTVPGGYTLSIPLHVSHVPLVTTGDMPAGDYQGAITVTTGYE
ncbi:hypothetical protein ABN789_004824 [Salmonella enterica]